MALGRSHKIDKNRRKTCFLLKIPRNIGLLILLKEQIL